MPRLDEVVAQELRTQRLRNALRVSRLRVALSVGGLALFLLLGYGLGRSA